MDFEEIYIPLEWADTVTGHPFLLETYGEELDMVRNAAPEHVWTLTDGDDGDMYVVAGLHTVNRINYIITERPWVTGEETFNWN